jgi:hypothetical protein
MMTTMTPDSNLLPAALTFAALLVAALGALLLHRVARGESDAGALDLSDGLIRLGDGPNVLRFRLEAQPSGRAAFRAETLTGAVTR